MKLLVDMGNSRVKWAWLERGELQDPGSAPHGPGLLSALLDSMGGDGRRAEEILVASVAAAAPTQALADGLAQRYGVAVRMARTGTAAHGVQNGYIEPRQLGVDRWLAMVAAFARYRKALCVVDAGTAVTIDALAGDGRHLGGFIVPGPALMRSALLRETGGIGVAADLLGRPAEGAGGWATDTESCMRLGSLKAIACLVEYCVKALPAPQGLLVLTGGDAPSLVEALSTAAEHRPLLVLEGLAVTFGDAND